MKSKTLLAALVLALSPGFAFAMCSGLGHTKTEDITMSCAAGTVYDAESRACVPTTG